MFRWRCNSMALPPAWWPLLCKSQPFGWRWRALGAPSSGVTHCLPAPCCVCNPVWWWVPLFAPLLGLQQQLAQPPQLAGAASRTFFSLTLRLLRCQVPLRHAPPLLHHRVDTGERPHSLHTGRTLLSTLLAHCRDLVITPPCQDQDEHHKMTAGSDLISVPTPSSRPGFPTHPQDPASSVFVIYTTQSSTRRTAGPSARPGSRHGAGKTFATFCKAQNAASACAHACGSCLRGRAPEKDTRKSDPSIPGGFARTAGEYTQSLAPQQPPLPCISSLPACPKASRSSQRPQTKPVVSCCHCNHLDQPSVSRRQRRRPHPCYTRVVTLERAPQQQRRNKCAAAPCRAPQDRGRRRSSAAAATIHHTQTPRGAAAVKEEPRGHSPCTTAPRLRGAAAGLHAAAGHTEDRLARQAPPSPLVPRPTAAVNPRPTPPFRPPATANTLSPANPSPSSSPHKPPVVAAPPPSPAAAARLLSRARRYAAMPAAPLKGRSRAPLAAAVAAPSPAATRPNCSRQPQAQKQAVIYCSFSM